MKYSGQTFIKTALAIVVLAGLAFYAYYGEFKRGKAEDEAKEAAKQLVALDKSTVTSIELEQNGTPSVTLQKSGGSWTIVSPVEIAADDLAADSLAGALSSIRTERTVDEKPSGLSNYGLDKPSIRAVIKTSSDKTVTLIFGVENTFDRTYYAMRDGDPRVYQVSSSVKNAVGKDLFALRDKRLFVFEKNDQVKSLDVILPDGGFTALTDGAGWTVTIKAGKERNTFRGDDEEIQKILNALRSARATSVEAEDGADQSKFRLGPSYAGISDINGTVEKVFLEKSDAGRVYARKGDRGPVFTVSEQFIKDMTKTPFELKFKKVLDFKREDIKKIAIKGPEGAFMLTRSGAAGDQWEFDGVAGAPEKAKAYKASSVLYALGGMKAIEFVATGKQSPLPVAEKPGKSISLMDASGKEISRLDVLGAVEKGYKVASTSFLSPVIVEKGKIDDLSFVKADYIDAPPPTATPGGKPGK